MNGTSVMTGIGIVNTINTRRLLNWVVLCSSAINEIVQAYDDHLSYELNQTKKHKGQREVAKQMRMHLYDSKLTRKREEFLYNKNPEVTVLKKKFKNIILYLRSSNTWSGFRYFK